MMFRIFLENFNNEFNMLTNSFEGKSHVDLCAQCVRMALTGSGGVGGGGTKGPPGGGGGGGGGGVGALKVYAL